ncbi:hypothetical protein [Cryobacterium sp.]|uniref:carbohydrate ABC transporter permease n=1 Tax=Cryobacterium sp. TaxID=1926290 RepID=UPI00260E2EDC|nr:hypothetical protein [Cryobacterium sp.]MCU1444601.1 sugar transporter permease [Cryobacterium sp.]
MSTLRPARPRKKGRSTPYLLVLPACGILILALGYPLVWQFITSMQKFGLSQQFGQPPEFVWFDNYETLFTDPYMWTVVARSLAFCLVTARVTMAIGTLMALLMDAVHAAVRIMLQISMLLAWAMPVVAAMTAWTSRTTTGWPARCPSSSSPW